MPGSEWFWLAEARHYSGRERRNSSTSAGVSRRRQHEAYAVSEYTLSPLAAAVEKKLGERLTLGCGRAAKQLVVAHSDP